jgi:urease accessory protein
LEVSVHAASDATAFISTQASTKVYRSPDGCSQHVDVRISDGAAIAIMPDPVVCFAGARYEQRLDAAMEPRGSLLLLDGYTCGRAARGERWQFDRYESRTTVMRDGRLLLVDATRLDAFPGPIADRMGRFDVILSLLALGPRFAPIRDRMLSHDWAPGLDDDTIAAASPLGANGAILRVAACRFENASRIFRSSFGLLAQLLGDDPFARKW